MKYLGIDYGTKRVGVAISDDAGEFAFPKAIAPSAEALGTIANLCKEEGIGAIVIGESIASNEVSNDLMPMVNAFKAKLTLATELPIFFEREGFSTVEAHRYQTSAGSRDDSAAAIILQRFLDKKKK
jgi:putative Holliday junction resolvase